MKVEEWVCVGCTETAVDHAGSPAAGASKR